MKKIALLITCIALVLCITVWAGQGAISSLSNVFDVPPESYRQPGVNPFVGKWVNYDPNTSSITKIAIGIEDNKMKVQVWGACTPEDCYWGQVDAQIPWCETERIQCTWIMSMMSDFQEITYMPGADYLIFRSKTCYTYDQSNRVDIQTMYFTRGDFQLPAL